VLCNNQYVHTNLDRKVRSFSLTSKPIISSGFYLFYRPNFLTNLLLRNILVLQKTKMGIFDELLSIT
jgi:hypothetical protein